MATDDGWDRTEYLPPNPSYNSWIYVHRVTQVCVHAADYMDPSWKIGPIGRRVFATLAEAKLEALKAERKNLGARRKRVDDAIREIRSVKP